MNAMMSVVAAVCLASCGSDGGAARDSGPGSGDGAILDGPIGADAGPCVVFQCASHIVECGDCADNDGDGVIDSRDPECLGPCDNTEGPALESGVGGTGGNTCMLDCYFDYGNGPGNDLCKWDHRCDALEPEAPLCTYNASMVGGTSCPDSQDPQCAEQCMPLTPNGCDCFGCCAMPMAGPGGTTRNVWIGAMDAQNMGTCTFADQTDETKCPTCTPVENCFNPCDPCEVCIGAPPPGPECDPDLQCPGGEQPCGLTGQPDCPTGQYCISGCCQEPIL
jgi:hypothetical protein